MSDKATVPPTAEAEEAKAFQLTVNIPIADRFLYCNGASFAVGLMDFRVSFVDMTQTSVVPQVGIAMAPEFVAHLVMTLLGQIHTYEKVFGPIRHPQWREFKALSEQGTALMESVLQKAAQAQAQALPEEKEV